MMRRLLDGWESLAAKPDVSSLQAVFSGGAPLSAALRDQFLETFPSVLLAEGYGSSETGSQATRQFRPGSAGGPEPSYAASNGVVLDEATHLPIQPGSGQVGRMARTGRIPIGYYNDPAKTAATVVDWDGRRWVLTGDMATVNEDGTIRLIGRGSLCINSGGEKIYPEEVEAALRHSPEIYDVVVVGVPDQRWGQAVVAVVALAAGAAVTDDELRDRARLYLAGYKVPKHIVFVDEVLRSPSGKADYRWGAEMAVKLLSEK
jgi:acyl-CoA synthetase (AMP-forming)/AMP-acid ligase II